MSNYSINSIQLSSFGFEAGQHSPSSNLAIAGAWDMPARLGETGYDWGDEKGFEPWVAPEDIRFGGRSIELVGIIKGNNRKNGQDKLYDLYEFLDSITSIATLSSDLYGTWQVFVNGPISTKYISNGWYQIRIPFRQPIVPLPSGPIGVPEAFVLTNNIGDEILSNLSNQILTSTFIWDGFGIDGYSFNDLGLIVLFAQGRSDRPAPKDFQTTTYINEGWAIRPTAMRSVNIRCLINQPSYEDFVKVTDGLHKLLAKPGLRTITLHDDALRTFYVPGGYKVTGVRMYAHGRFYGFLEMQLHEIGFSDNDKWGELTDNTGIGIVSEFGNIITTV